jgi:hypothetical protein
MEPTSLRRQVLPPRQAPCDPREQACDLVSVKRKREATWTLVLLMGAATAIAQILEKLL